jgi:AcrR family transcriptional regulator
MPKLWEQTVVEHRRAVGDAILDAAAALAEQQGPRAVTMSQVAGRAGIGRATLYKYFPDVDAILLAWQERQLAEHATHLHQLAHSDGPAVERLRAVLTAFAFIYFEHGDSELAILLHQGPHVAAAHRHLSETLHAVTTEAVAEREVRDDVPVPELVTYALHSVTAAATLKSETAVRRLINVVLAGIMTSPQSTHLRPAAPEAAAPRTATP